MNYTINVSDELLGKQQINKIFKQYNSNQDMMNTMVFDCLETNIDYIIEYCQTSPFFAEYKFAILKNPAFLYSEKTSVDFEEFVEKLKQYLLEDNNQTILIIYNVDTELDKRKNITKFIKEHTKFINIDTPDAMIIEDLISKKFRKYGNEISADAIKMLLEKVGKNLSDISNEIEKLSLYKPEQKITTEDIVSFASYNLDNSIFDLSNAIMSKDITRSLDLYENLIKEGLEPIALIALLASNFRTSLLTIKLRDMGVKPNMIAKRLKKHPWVITKALQLSHSKENIAKNLERLADLDYLIKIGRVNKYQGLKVFILNV